MACAGYNLATASWDHNGFENILNFAERAGVKLILREAPIHMDGEFDGKTLTAGQVRELIDIMLRPDKRPLNCTPSTGQKVHQNKPVPIRAHAEETAVRHGQREPVEVLPRR